MQEEFKSINQETICAANKVAERMLKELKKTKTDYQQSRELYFACLEIHSIFYSDETEEWIRDSLESTDWKTIFNQDLQECMSGFSSKGITLEKIEEVTPQIIERYSYLVK